ncbi:hypothetical protein NKH55_02000 [Mesorhizobium opportunistum]|uniref:hypothetical protein n=1 Tax=Mesorhizobium opportunistum TaxID=593909 RepID=UPI00333671FE
MPNTSVRAAAEGMPDYPRNPHRFAFVRKVLMFWHARAGREPVVSNSVPESFMNQHVDRRALLTSSAIASAAMAAASQEARAGGTSAFSVSPELEALIEAKRAAYAAFNEVLDSNYEIEEAYFGQHKKELFVDLSIGGAQSFHPDFERDFLHQDVRADIVRRYDEQRRKLAVIEKLDSAVAAQAMAALRAGQAKDLRTFRQVLRDEIGRRKAFGLWQAKEAEDEASTADLDTFTALCAYRCINFAELTRKAEVIAHYTGPKFTEIQADDFNVFLGSMMADTSEEGGAA